MHYRAAEEPSFRCVCLMSANQAEGSRLHGVYLDGWVDGVSGGRHHASPTQGSRRLRTTPSPVKGMNDAA